MAKGNEKIILIIGEVYLDVYLDIRDGDNLVVRPGGIFHSVRGLSAVNANYAIAYYAPDYLENHIDSLSSEMNKGKFYKLGSIKDAPNVMLIKESKESCDQGYNNIYGSQAIFIETGDLDKILNIVNPTDILIYPGRYNTKEVIKKISKYDVRIHIDFHYDSEDILDGISCNIATIILSSSSSIFRKLCHETLDGILNFFQQYKVDGFLVKENRGGSYYFHTKAKIKYESPSYFVKTLHSVGVGDVYNSIFVNYFSENEIDKNMRLSSHCAAYYARTVFFENFRNDVELLLNNLDEFQSLEGIRLSWEERKEKNLYIAAPDFPNVDTEPLKKLVECLEYHNFTPRLPVKENGLVDNSMNNEDKIKIYYKDVELLHICDLLIAVLLYNDPGTLVELGMFHQTGKPTILYDPYGYCTNMFTRLTPNYYCRDIEEVISYTYLCLRRR